ncbi:18351_t:CDS:2, partial [Dentiscutata erythropus]
MANVWYEYFDETILKHGISDKTENAFIKESLRLIYYRSTDVLVKIPCNPLSIEILKVGSIATFWHDFPNICEEMSLASIMRKNIPREESEKKKLGHKIDIIFRIDDIV